MSRRSLWLAAGGIALSLIAVSAIQVALDNTERRAGVASHEERQETARGLVAAVASAHAAKESASCDANALWFDGTWPGTPEENQAAFVVRVSGWTPECRATAFRSECARGCDDFISDMILEATETPEEKLELTQFRFGQNVDAARTARAMLGKVKKFTSYAMSIVGSPRGSRYRKPNATLEERTAEIAAGNPCMERMQKDFAEIRSLEAELKAQLPNLPEGFVGLLGALVLARGCVDCTDNRSGCQDMQEDLKNANELLAEREKLVARDKLAIARSPGAAP